MDSNLCSPLFRNSVKAKSPSRGQSFRAGFHRVCGVFVLTLLIACSPKFLLGNTLYVTTASEAVDAPGCSLRAAILAANQQTSNLLIGSNTIVTGCVPGSGADTIVLPTNAFLVFTSSFYEIDNPFGATALPMIRGEITIRGAGATLAYFGTLPSRAFAVSSTGFLTIRELNVTGFNVKGGNGRGGGGGGAGLGGAIYVKGSGTLIVDSSTFYRNGAIGGNGSYGYAGGGGGLGGNGGVTENKNGYQDGGGGGGSGGDGQDGLELIGGAGGGTIPGSNLNTCGGAGGSGYSLTFAGPQLGGNDGHDAPCAGGGGGGGQTQTVMGIVATGSGSGGKGNYGGGGGGGGGGPNDSGNGGAGGVGGGGGGGSFFATGAGCDGFGSSGGDGGFAGGGGAGGKGELSGGPGAGGIFGGGGTCENGGGGGALGGAIFNDGGTLTVTNSTFNRNFVDRGLGGASGESNRPAGNGGDAGGAIFSLHGTVTVLNSTIDGNEGTGAGGGIVIYQAVGFPPVPTSVHIENTIIAGNGPLECGAFGQKITGSAIGNLIQANDNCPGVTSNSDPQLAALALNYPGRTLTMALSTSSPAFNSGDLGSALETDQRGMPRPEGGAPDIGAFELCVPLNPFDHHCELVASSIATPLTGIPLTVLINPPGGGTSTPSGTTNEPADSVTPVSVVPAAGYTFFGWFGPVVDPTSPQTYVIMDGPQVVVPTFIALPTTIFGNLVGKSGPGNARAWTLSFQNNGPGGASETQVNSFTLTQTFGPACRPVLKSNIPLIFANLAPGQTGSTNVTIDFTGCAALARFTLKFGFSANGGQVTGSVTRANQFQ
jgi:CSLREA domain-containing protein